MTLPILGGNACGPYDVVPSAPSLIRIGRDGPEWPRSFTLERKVSMAHPLSRSVVCWGAALVLLAGTALPARARTPNATSTEHIRRLKTLEQQLLMKEPAERRLEQRERERGRREHHRAGSKLRPAEGSDEANAGAQRPSTAHRLVTSGIQNYLANNPAGDGPGSCQSEVSIAAIGDHVLAAWNDGQVLYDDTLPGFQGYGYSLDGGITWTDGGSPPAANVVSWVSDPVVVADPRNGSFYYVGLCDPGNGTNGIGVVRGSFSGSSFVWDTPVVVRAYDSNSSLLDKEWLAIDPANGNLYLSYSRFIGSGGVYFTNQIDFERSTDGGQTWTDLQTLSAPDDAGYVQGSRPAVGPDGEVYVVWWAIGHASNSLFGRDFMRVRKSTTAGTSFATEVTADSLFSNWGSGAPGFNRGIGVTFPSIAVDRSNGPNRGRVYVAWNEGVNFYEDDLGLARRHAEREPNDSPSQATAFTVGEQLNGVIDRPATSKSAGDFDYYRFQGVQGQTVIFYMDSLDVNLDAAFRLFCTDVDAQGRTGRLAFSLASAPNGGLLVFTPPADGTYYIRVASYLGNSIGGYHIATGNHVPDGAPIDDRARDHRDVFVTSSANGTTWGPTVRATDDPGYFDDWLPEVAVAGDGKAFCAYYDWRDPAQCGGLSNVYMVRSDDGGLSWGSGLPITTAESDWTFGSSSLIPNQGDYIALFGADTTAIVGWADNRYGDPDVFVAKSSLNCTAAQITASATATLDTATVTWGIANGPGAAVKIYRRLQGAAQYDSVGIAVANGSGGITFYDTTVVAGRTYDYRLGLEGFCQNFAGTVAVSVPFPPGLALGAYPNPTSGSLTVTFTLPSGAPASLDLYDLSGRRVRSQSVAGPGRQSVDLTRLKAGLYILRLTQAKHTATKRVAVFPGAAP